MLRRLKALRREARKKALASAESGVYAIAGLYTSEADAYATAIRVVERRGEG